MKKYHVKAQATVELLFKVSAESAAEAEAKADRIAAQIKAHPGHFPDGIPNGTTVTWPALKTWDWDLAKVVAP